MPSVGLQPVGAQVGEATWSFRCAGGSRSEWSWVAGPPDPRERFLRRIAKTCSYQPALLPQQSKRQIGQ